MLDTMANGRHSSGVRQSPHVTQSVARSGPTRWPTGRRWWVLVLLALGVLFVGLRGLHAVADQPQESAIFTDRVVVVGVTGRTELTPADRAVLGSHLDDAQAGMVSVRPRYVGDCAAAGWTTLGAGRRAAVGGLCAPEVQNGKVTDWTARQAAAAARRGDAQLGTLAGSVTGCVAAVGPGAALAAAKPDGSVASYQAPEEFVAGGMQTQCPITLVDAGPLSDQIITQLADREDITLIVTGVGPAAGSDDPSLQVIYRLGTTLPGWLTSASTRREGIVTLTDLTRTLIDFGAPGSSVAVDGSPFAVYRQTSHSMASTPRSTRLPRFQTQRRLATWYSASAAVAVCDLGSRYAAEQVCAAQADLDLRWGTPAAMMLTGAVPWQNSGSPGLFLSLLVAAWSVILTALGAPHRPARTGAQRHRRGVRLPLLRSPLTRHWVR